MNQFFSLVFSCFLIFFGPVAQATENDIVFAYVGNIKHSAHFGVGLGLNEANLQGQFLGQKYRLESFTKVSELPEDLEKYSAIFAALPYSELLTLIEKAQYFPVFNLIAEDNTLRSACHANILSTIPSLKMKQDAAIQWKSKHPDSIFTALGWHHKFNKFAARDLNKRYKKEFELAMDDYAWAGWAAIRMSADSAVRESITHPVEMLNHLKTNLSFDGQKGLNMSFRDTGQLRQLILIVENDKPVSEAPVRGISSDIDSLGIIECEK